jgi:hypothetical protein
MPARDLAGMARAAVCERLPQVSASGRDQAHMRALTRAVVGLEPA